LRNSSGKRRKRKPKRLKKLKNKKILLGVTGGVAAYKAVDLVRRMREAGASVIVMMTGASQRFITPLSLSVASGNKVYTSLFEDPLSHIDLPAWADLFVVAPATADFVAKMANGIADDLLSTSLLSYTGKVIIAPSMNWRMYENPIFQQNLGKLLSLGVRQAGPAKGSLACGEEGLGRMAEVADILDVTREELSGKDLQGLRVVVTAGPTREYIDPVRYISNRSSGKMGYALAKAARNRGAEVTLISGPSSLEMPSRVEFRKVETSDEMAGAVAGALTRGADLLIMAAAVADFAPLGMSGEKIAKEGCLSLQLRATEDIIATAAKRSDRPFIIGFAAETGTDLERASKKMKGKNIDMIVFNDVTEEGAGFDVDTNRVVIIDGRGRVPLELMGKDLVAEAILDRFAEIKS
jgi:phosphopantothenoylcysteine decarboxylase/phosphopantothenate--cysteine ligase